MEKIKNIIYEAEIYNSNIETIIKKLNEASAETNIKLSIIEDFAQVIENEKEELYELKSNMSVTDKYLSEFTFRFNPITLTTLRLFQNELKEFLISGLTVYDIFESHMNEMKAKKGYDKYYHAKANCEGTILGNTEKLFSILFSVGKEVYDIYYKTTNKVLSFDEAWNDSMNDLKADWYGIQQAKSNLKCGEAVRNVKQHIEKN